MSQPIHPQHQRPPIPGQQSHQTHDPERQRRDRRPRQERTTTSSSNRRPKPKSSGRRGGRTIPSLLRYMEGLEVVAELKTGRRIQGILVVAEDDMNITLEVPASSSPSFVLKQQEEQEQGRLSSETEPTARPDGEIRHSQNVEYDTHGNISKTNSNSPTIFDIHRGGFLNDATGDDDGESDPRPAAATAATSSSVENHNKSNNNTTNIKNESVNIHIRGSEIRYIQFPDNVQPSKIVSVGMERERLAAKKYQKTMRR